MNKETELVPSNGFFNECTNYKYRSMASVCLETLLESHLKSIKTFSAQVFEQILPHEKSAIKVTEK